MADQLLGSWLNEGWKRMAVNCIVTLWFIWLIIVIEKLSLVIVKIIEKVMMV